MICVGVPQLCLSHTCSGVRYIDTRVGTRRFATRKSKSIFFLNFILKMAPRSN